MIDININHTKQKWHLKFGEGIYFLVGEWERDFLSIVSMYCLYKDIPYIEVNGENNYGFRMRSYYNMKNGGTTTTYYDLTDITGGGDTKKISVQGKNNVGISIAQGKSSGDPLSKITKLNVFPIVVSFKTIVL